MTIVDITIGKRQIQLECTPGEEQKLKSLASDLDRRVTAIGKSLGEGNDKILLLMAALMMQDEINELQKKTGEPNSGESEQEVLKIKTAVDSISKLCLHIEDIADRLEKV